MGKEALSQVEVEHGILHRLNPKRNRVRHILIKLTKIKYKEKILKAKREKQQITYKRMSIRMTADLLAETLKATRELKYIFKVMKGRNLETRILYPAKPSFRFNGDIQS